MLYYYVYSWINDAHVFLPYWSFLDWEALGSFFFSPKSMKSNRQRSYSSYELRVRANHFVHFAVLLIEPFYDKDDFICVHNLIVARQKCLICLSSKFYQRLWRFWTWWTMGQSTITEYIHVWIVLGTGQCRIFNLHIIWIWIYEGIKLYALNRLQSYSNR